MLETCDRWVQFIVCGDDGELTALEPVRRAILAWRSAAYDGEGIEQSADSKVKLTQAEATFCSQGYYCPGSNAQHAVPTRNLAEILGKGEVSRYNADLIAVTRMRSRSFLSVYVMLLILVLQDFWHICLTLFGQHIMMLILVQFILMYPKKVTIQVGSLNTWIDGHE